MMNDISFKILIYFATIIKMDLINRILGLSKMTIIEKIPILEFNLKNFYF